MNSGKMRYVESHSKNREILYTPNASETDKRPLNFARRKSLVQVGEALCSKEGTYSGVRDYTKPSKTSAAKGKRKENQQLEGKRAEGEALAFLRTCVS